MTTDNVRRGTGVEIAVSLVRLQMTNGSRTTIMIYRDEKSALNQYAEERFGHSDVTYRSIVKSLLEEAGIELATETT